MSTSDERRPAQNGHSSQPDSVSAHVQTHGNQVVITIDIADHCRNDRPHPTPDPGQEVVYVLMIDGDKYKTTNSNPTGEEILALAGKNSRQYQLNQQRREHGKVKVTRVKPTDKVDLAEWGIEMFMTLPLDNTEGAESAIELAPRRQFVLPEADTEYLNGHADRWETLVVNGQMCLLMHGLGLPDGYTVSQVDVAVLLPSEYPRCALDMVYVHPPVHRKDGQQINNLAIAPWTIDGKAFQMWSRHRTGINPWRMGVDNLGTHLEQARLWFDQEFDKRPRLDHPVNHQAYAVRA
ncbi:multiubiquitin domain-containing protein [Hymenobacter wooponensis]|uniref:Multi-ubiquitin domain-containing protein n=1 Tax=Hymenobacter wooponensis TaxID=1525360 RepID=A0A4Z0MBN9_9BACT|nr:multiubiquitin domain-containing protein [Hymenobacter wooponensis]TGD76909.1 hypothetical protein EU557_24930 [Hymenobacter wooponensis]